MFSVKRLEVTVVAILWYKNEVELNWAELNAVKIIDSLCICMLCECTVYGKPQRWVHDAGGKVGQGYHKKIHVFE